MGEFDDSVMVALLPTTSDWCKIDLPHLTLVYCGKIPDLKPTTQNDLAKVAVTIAQVSNPLTLDVLGVDILGDKELVDVLLLRPTPELISMYKLLEFWDATEYRFKPHVTIGPSLSARDYTPSSLTFDRIMVSWGKDQLTYKFSSFESPF